MNSPHKGPITRAASWGTDRRKWLYSAVRGGICPPPPPPPPQHARPSIIHVECHTCCYQVCALDHAKGGAENLDYHSEPCHRTAVTRKKVSIWWRHQGQAHHHWREVGAVWLRYDTMHLMYYTSLSIAGAWHYFFLIISLCVSLSSQRPVTRSFDVFFDLWLNKGLVRLVIWDAIVPIMTSV